MLSAVIWAHIKENCEGSKDHQWFDGKNWQRLVFVEGTFSLNSDG